MKISESDKKDLIAWILESGFHESVTNGKSYGFVNKELKQVVDFGKDTVEAFILVDGERHTDTILLSKMMMDFRDEVQKANGDNQNTEIILMPDKLTKELLDKYQALSLFEKLTLFQNTDLRYVKNRKGYGNMTFSYVEGHYITQVLNLVTGYRWDCHIEKITETDKEVICQGKIILHVPNRDNLSFVTIEKSAIGQADKKFSIQDKSLIMIGDTYKAAEMDMIKKAASYLGIAADVYRGEV